MDYIGIIEGLRQQIYMMGANDVEFGQIDSILNSFKNGDISGDEAAAKAQTVLDGKQNYH